MVSNRLVVIAALVAIGAAVAYVRILNTGENGNTSRHTAEDVSEGVDLTGKVALVTGAGTGGIGYETARVLALRGAAVFVHGRSASRAGETVEALLAEPSLQALPTPPSLTPIVGDLASVESIRSMAADFQKTGSPLHLLILNAGVMAVPQRETTADGYEKQMGINHLGHTLLTGLLLPQLRASAPARVVSLSSAAHRMANMSFVDSPTLETVPYRPFIAYGNSKMANVLFASEFNRRYSSEGVTAVSVHPGVIMTRLSRHMLGPNGKIPWQFVVRMPYILAIRKNVPQGAATSVYAATSPEIDDLGLGGLYFEDSHVSELEAEQYRAAVATPEAGQKLWKATEALLGRDF